MSEEQYTSDEIMQGIAEHTRRRMHVYRDTVKEIEALLDGGPNTPCRTTWHDGVEYVEVPAEELQRILGPSELERMERIFGTGNSASTVD